MSKSSRRTPVMKGGVHTSECKAQAPGQRVLLPIANSGLNLGGLGCGGIELWPDGLFRHPQFINNRPWAGRERGHNYAVDAGYAPPEPPWNPEDLFFILRVQQPGQSPQLRFLMLGAGERFGQEMSRTYKYAVCPTVQGIEYRGEFPFIRLCYIDERLPVEVRLDAWTAFIPHDSASSSLPGAVFDFVITNHSAGPVDVAVVCCCSNLAGFDTSDFHHRHVQLAPTQGRIIRMSGGADPRHPTSGDMSLFARRGFGQTLTSIEANPYLENLFHTIYTSGDLVGPLEPRHISRVEYLSQPETEAYHRDKGWLCLAQRLAPSAVAEFRLGLSWFFPNHFDRKGHRVGKFYENHFVDSAEVAAHLLEHGDDLKRRSAIWPQSVLASTMERRFALSLLDQLNTLTKSSWYSKKGHFFLWEGLGCCGLNTVDVDHYASFALLSLFPDLRQDVLDHAAEGQLDDGRICHSFAQVCEVERDNHHEYRRWDVSAQYLLALFRDWRWTGNSALLQRHYPHARKAYRLLRGMDRYGVGLPYIEGGLTYDHWRMKGIVTYMVGLYLAACQAMTRMAGASGDLATARDTAEAFERGRESFEKLLWNGDYYSLFYRRHYRDKGSSDRLVGQDEIAGDQGDFEPTTCEAGSGCCAKNEIVSVEVNEGLQTDALNGEAYARLIGLPRMLNAGRVRATLRQVLDRSSHADLGFLANGSYEDGRYPDHWPFSQWQNPWTGTEYFFAAHLFLEGLHREGLELIDNVFDRLEAAGMRFNHVECGTHYARPLSIYAAYAAWLGLDYDIPGECLRLQPLPRSGSLRAPLLTPLLLGEMEWRCADTASLTLRITHGQAPLRRLITSCIAGKDGSLSLDKKPLVFQQDHLALVLRQRVTLAPGSVLVCTFGRPRRAPKKAAVMAAIGGANE